MRVHLCVCVCARARVRVRGCVSVCTCVRVACARHMCACMRARGRGCVHVRVRALVRVCVRAREHVRVRALVRARGFGSGGVYIVVWSCALTYAFKCLPELPYHAIECLYKLRRSERLTDVANGRCKRTDVANVGGTDVGSPLKCYTTICYKLFCYIRKLYPQVTAQQCPHPLSPSRSLCWPHTSSILHTPFLLSPSLSRSDRSFRTHAIRSGA